MSCVYVLIKTLERHVLETVTALRLLYRPDSMLGCLQVMEERTQERRSCLVRQHEDHSNNVARSKCGTAVDLTIPRIPDYHGAGLPSELRRKSLS